MTSRDFCYWLQGFFEITDESISVITPKQVECIKNHLNLVFKHEIDPSINSKHTEEEVKEMNSIHGGEVFRC